MVSHSFGLILALALGAGASHPIHSSSAAVVLGERDRTVTVVLRVFAEDFPPGSAPEAAAGYLGERFRLVGSDGSPIRLSLEQQQRDGAVLVFRLRGSLRELRGARIWHGVLAERFPDQVNVVQARYGGRTVSLLFTAGDGLKSLP